ncbi:MAG: fibronectin type III domain-containing protein [Actinomycetota bacterium]|nr:fibronectin type III domain-containing protein [Actinomycetota bacterium]
MRERQSTKRVALAGALAAVLGAALVLALTGTRESASALRLLSGDVWLGNGSTGTASHVNGYSGKVDGQASVTSPHDPFSVIQRPDGAYVLDLKTGRLTRVGSAGLDVTGSRQLAGTPAALQVLTSGSTTWVLDHSSGVLQQVDPTTLAANGPQIPLGASTGPATIDANGNVWVPIPSRATVEEVSASDHALSPHPLGQPGDQVVVAATSTGVWGIDTQAGQARSLTNATTAPLQLSQTAAGIAPLVGFSTSSDRIAVVEGSSLLDINTAQPSVSSTSSPSFGGAVSVVVNGNTAYVLNAATHQLNSVNLSPLGPGPSANVPPGSNQLVSKDNLVFVNDPASPQAVVVNANGQVTPITKYLPGTPAPNPAASPLRGTPDPVGNQPIVGPSGPLRPSGPSGSSTPGPPVAGTAAPGASAGTPPGAQPTTTPPPIPQAPGAPTVTTVSATAGSLAVTWSVPASTGSSPLTTYKVSALPQGAGKLATTTTNGTTTTATVTGLSGGVTYCAQVQAVNAVGGGPLSANDGSPTVCAKTTSDTPGQMATPTATGGVGQITLSWAQPALGPYSTPIGSYDVSATPQGGGAAVLKSATASPFALTGLNAGTAYDVRVAATNQTGGKGQASPPAAARTDGQPGTFSVTVDAYANELDASWTKPSVDNGQSVTYTAAIGATKKLTSGQSAQFTGLTAGTSYTVTVTATDAAGSTTSTGTATPWGRTSALQRCYSTDKGNEFITASGTCEQLPNGGILQNRGTVSFNWATSQPPKGSTPLSREYGTTTPNNNNSGTQYWFTSANGPAPAGLLVTSGPGPTTWVFTTAAAAGPGTSHVCEALVRQTFMGRSTSYYELFAYGTQPSACVLDFWT